MKMAWILFVCNCTAHKTVFFLNTLKYILLHLTLLVTIIIILFSWSNNTCKLQSLLLKNGFKNNYIQYGRSNDSWHYCTVCNEFAHCNFFWKSKIFPKNLEFHLKWIVKNNTILHTYIPQTFNQLTFALIY